MDFKLYFEYCMHAIITHSWLETTIENWILEKKLLKNKKMDSKNRLKNIQAKGYISACTIDYTYVYSSQVH